MNPCKFKIGDTVEYLRQKSPMFPYKLGTVIGINGSEWSGNYQIGVDFRPIHKAPEFWVWESDLRLLTPLEKEML